MTNEETQEFVYGTFQMEYSKNQLTWSGVCMDETYYLCGVQTTLGYKSKDNIRRHSPFKSHFHHIFLAHMGA